MVPNTTKMSTDIERVEHPAALTSFPKPTAWAKYKVNRFLPFRSDSSKRFLTYLFTQNQYSLSSLRSGNSPLKYLFSTSSISFLTLRNAPRSRDPSGLHPAGHPISGVDLGQAAGTICVVSVYSYPRDRSISFKPSRWGVGNSGSFERVDPASLSEIVLGRNRRGSRISKWSLRSELHSVQASGAGYWRLVVAVLGVTVLSLLACISGPSTAEYHEGWGPSVRGRRLGVSGISAQGCLLSPPPPNWLRSILHTGRH